MILYQINIITLLTHVVQTRKRSWITKTDLLFCCSLYLFVHQPLYTASLIYVALPHYVKTTTEDRKDFMCAVVTVIYGMCNSVRLLYLLVVTVRKWSINPVTKPNPVDSQSHTWLYTYMYLNRRHTSSPPTDRKHLDRTILIIGLLTCFHRKLSFQTSREMNKLCQDFSFVALN
jgi:hypothetical protein